MPDTTTKFDDIPRLQQIAAIIRERGAYTFDAPATASYYIECAIKEIERLHRDYSCICSEMRRMMEERDEARRMACEALFESWKEFANNSGECGGEPWTPQRFAKEEGWDCFNEVTDGR